MPTTRLSQSPSSPWDETTNMKTTFHGLVMVGLCFRIYAGMSTKLWPGLCTFQRKRTYITLSRHVNLTTSFNIFILGMAGMATGSDDPRFPCLPFAAPARPRLAREPPQWLGALSAGSNGWPLKSQCLCSETSSKNSNNNNHHKNN